jgi:tRNA (guanine-N7-)-methyltransferase
LGPLFPDKLVVGLEIRGLVVDFVEDRLRQLRSGASGAVPSHANVGVLRANAMKHLANHFPKASLDKLFFTFPDPHFKRANHRRRIIGQALLAEYAYVLRPGARLYTATDVLELHEWMRDHLAAHPCFEPVPAAELALDPCVPLLQNATEEARKVAAAGGQVHLAIFTRRPPPAGPSAPS